MDSISPVPSASSIQTDFMKLLIEQMRNQNPLEPMDNTEMASQLAQFSQLSQLESMNSTFAEVLDSIERTYASSLIGKEISFLVETSDGTLDVRSGIVEQVAKNEDGKMLLVTGDYALSIKDVIAVKNPG
jgi:flagellar basal-body rod modification protein FlgD